MIKLKNHPPPKLCHLKPYTSIGFTLVELLVTIAILGIIISIATPRFIELLQRLEAKDIRSKVTTAIRTSKAESFIRHQHVIMCLANSSNQCNKNATARLIVFTDKNDNHSFDATEDTFLLIQALNLDYGNTHLRAGGRHYVKFFGDTGLPRGHFGHIKYCPNSITNLNKYLISFNQLGGIKFKPNKTHATNCPS